MNKREKILVQWLTERIVERTAKTEAEISKLEAEMAENRKKIAIYDKINAELPKLNEKLHDLIFDYILARERLVVSRVPRNPAAAGGRAKRASAWEDPESPPTPEQLTAALFRHRAAYPNQSDNQHIQRMVGEFGYVGQNRDAPVETRAKSLRRFIRQLAGVDSLKSLEQ